MQIDAHKLMITFGSSGEIGLVDVRESNLLTSRKWKVMAKGSAKTVSVHPVDEHLVLGANNKAECNIFDIRSVPGNRVTHNRTPYQIVL